MRTTLNIDEDALLVIKRYAEAREISLGQAASDLVYRGAENLPQLKTKNGWVIFDLPSGAPALTNEKVQKLENEGHEEEYRRAFSPRR
ncbi:MAG: CopG family transcriptional regulator [Acidobacteriota bacterium]